MASRSKGEREGQLFRELAMIQEGEPVLTFRGPKMRRGECILADTEDTKVRYLVRYERGGVNVPREEWRIPEAAPQIEPELEPETEPAPEGDVHPVVELETEPISDAEVDMSGPEAGPTASISASPSPRRGRSPMRIAKRRHSRSRRSRRGSPSRLGSPSPKRRRRCSPSPSQRRSRSPSRSSSSSTISLVEDEDLLIPSEEDCESPSSSPGAGRAGASAPLPPQQPEGSRMPPKQQLYSIVVIGGWEYEWVPENRLLRYSAVHMQLDCDTALQMAAKKEEQEDCPVSSSGGSTSGAAAAAPESPLSKRGRRGKRREMVGSRSQRRKSQGGRGAAGDVQSEIQLYLPKVLKPLLVQDWELVTSGKKLFTLPARKTVDAILTEYVSVHESSGSAAKKHAVSELMAMIKEYFDLVLGTQLLYNFERPQYAAILISQPTAQMSQVYGGAHLLRLFPQLGSMLSCTSLGGGSLNVLLSHLNDFLEYLASDPSLLYIDPVDYQLATEEYQQSAE